MTIFTPRDEGYRDRIVAYSQHTIFADFYKFRVESIDPGHVVLGVDGRPELGHRPGWFQGTVITAIAEFAAGYSSATLVGAGWISLTIVQTINFVGQARGERLVARGRVIQPGRTITVASAEIFAVRDGGEHLCAVMQQTNHHMPPA